MKKLIRMSEVMQRRPESKSKYYVQMAEGLLPKSIFTSDRISSFVESEIEASIELDIAASRPPAGGLEDWADSYVKEHGEQGQWFWNRVKYHQANGRGIASRNEGVSPQPTVAA